MCQNGACYIILLLLSLAPDEKLAPFSLRLQTAFVSLVWVSQAGGLLLHAKFFVSFHSLQVVEVLAG